MNPVIRVRMSECDAHYGGSLVDGAKLLSLFGDLATELLIHNDGDEGLFRAYEKIDFLSPVYAGDYIEATGKIVSAGNTSRKMEFSAYKVISKDYTVAESAAKVLDPPKLVCTAKGTCVVLKQNQRKNRQAFTK